MTLTSPIAQPDECYRCGYALFGIADDQPCPECGLLAERSRRIDDELHNTRPRWLRRLSIGVRLILLAIGMIVVSPLVADAIGQTATGWFVSIVRWTGIYAALIPLFVGILMLTSKEGYAAADRADRKPRIILRFAAFAPIAAVAMLQLYDYVDDGNVFLGMFNAPAWLRAAGILVATVGCAPLPLLLFRRLRGLATRAHSAHLAEHCIIVGVGTSVSLLYVAIFFYVMENPESIGLEPYWVDRSNISLGMTLLAFLAAILFALWSLYLMLRFAIAFHFAASKLRHQWRRDDRAADPVANTSKV